MKSVTELPFNAFVGLEVHHSGPELRLPESERYLNHIGTIHAGALLTLAEAASGEFLLAKFKGESGIVPVVRRMEAKFRKAARGAITATARVDDGAWTREAEALSTKGRAMIAVNVQLCDESGAAILSATVEWFIQRAPLP